MSIGKVPAPRLCRHGASWWACLGVVWLSSALSAQCIDWPNGCPLPKHLAISDADNLPELASPVFPGDTDELTVCPPTVNDNKRRQLDVTDTLTTIVDDLLYLRSFYNSNSAASTTTQYWFFDIDIDPTTGGPDEVRPWYVDTGPVVGQGPAPCSTPGCSLQWTMPVRTGFEYYIMSYGQNANQFAIFAWNDVAMAWQEQPQPATPATNIQSAEPNPMTEYTGNNGFRAVSYIPKEAVGITANPYWLFTRSWNCTECCGDTIGGEGIVYPPGTQPCSSTLCGDCDDSGSVDILDSLFAASTAAGMTAEVDDRQFSNCNVVGAFDPLPTAAITVLDALQIAQYVVGLVPLSCCIP